MEKDGEYEADTSEIPQIHTFVGDQTYQSCHAARNRTIGTLCSRMKTTKMTTGCIGPGGNELEYDVRGLPLDQSAPELYRRGRFISHQLDVIDVRCEACHGPGGDHVEFVSGPEGGEASGERIREDLNLTRNTSQINEINTCAPCHSLLCMSCHESEYNNPENYFHEPNTEVSQCINCYMTERVYMGNDYHRDHSFRVLRPDQSKQFGTRNACNNCHGDRLVEWAVDTVD